MKTVDKRNNKLAYLIIGVVVFAAIIITVVLNRW